MHEKKRYFMNVPFIMVLVAVISVGIIICTLTYRFDNKYANPYPARMGIMELDMEAFEDSTCYYLVDGWEYYDGRLLTPEDVPSDTPDEYIYLGQYAGFDRGDPDKSPYGSATYRLTIITDDKLRNYALELLDIFSEWKIYINGSLMAASGGDIDDSAMLAPENWMVTFEAQDIIEILISVSDDSHLYSGMIYPPAFGTPKAVGEVLTQRLLVHSAAAAAALLGAVFCLLTGLGYWRTRPFHLLTLLCLSIVGSISYPLIQALGLTWDGWSVIERLCYYGIFFAMILLQSRLCQIPKKVSMPLIVFGSCVLISVLLQPFISIDKAGIKYIYSSIIEFYKWLTAIWLLGTGMWAVWRKVDYSRPLLAGACFFACTLVMDRVYPMFEPMRLGWFVEIAGFVLFLLITGILWRETVRVYKDGVKMEMELALVQEKEKSLIELNHMKSRFLSNISHELQMPITVMSGYAQLAGDELTDDALDIPELQDHMRRIVYEGDRMERLVAQLLDVTRLETERFTLQIAPVSMTELLTQIMEDYFPMLNDHNNTLVLTVEPNLPPILCDNERILQLLINLISNACRHTCEGIITIDAHIKEDKMVVSVADTGEGMTLEMQERLFERYMSNAMTNGKANGTGLGLYICKSIAEAHDGEISITSEEGAGTTICLMLPLSPTI